MIRQIWSINDYEKDRILSLHKNATKKLYLTEQEEKSVKEFNITNSFDSGKFNLTNTAEIDSAISEILSISKQNPNVNYEVVVESSESKVPNRGVGLNPGDLSIKRGQTAEKYIKSKLGNGVNVVMKNLGTQGPSWDPSKGSGAPEYAKYQYVKIKLVVATSKRECEFDIKSSGTTGNPKTNYITSTIPLNKSVKGFLKLTSGSIPDRMVIVNNQNQIVKDTGYVATNKHQYPPFKYVPIYVSQLTSMNGSPAVSGDKIITIEVSTFEELISQILLEGQTLPETIKLRSMGGEVTKGLSDLKQLFDKGVRTYVLYTITNEPATLDYDISEGDKSALVISPIGQTGYQVQGLCTS